MKLSIGMATYNGAQYVEEQLQSFVVQTRQPDELVVVDDGSTDETLDLVRAFARDAPFEVRLEQNAENLGYAQNFGKAISLCQGDLIFLSDQDDVWLHSKLERVCAEFLKRPDAQLVINDARIVDGDLVDTGLTKLGQTHALGLKDAAFLTGCCSAFRSSLRSVLLPIPEEIFVHDTWLHALGDILEVRVVVDEPLQLYRRHGANASHGLQTATTALTRQDLFKTYSGGNSFEFTERAQQKINLLRLRLRSDQHSDAKFDDVRVAAALGELDEWEAAVRSRIRLLARSRIQRLGPATSMYFKGQYDRFSGWRSFAKDLIKS